MSFVETKLTGDLEADLTRFAKDVQGKVLYSGAAGMAAVMYAEVVQNASGNRGGSLPGRKTGNLAGSIYQVYSPEKSTDDKKTYRVSWNKKKAPHGHLIEFGTSRAPAFPFVRPAFDRIGAAIQEGQARMKKRLAEET